MWNIYDQFRTQNLYTYCSNNPINFIDPTGHAAFAVDDYSNASLGVDDNGYAIGHDYGTPAPSGSGSGGDSSGGGGTGGGSPIVKETKKGNAIIVDYITESNLYNNALLSMNNGLYSGYEEVELKMSLEVYDYKTYNLSAQDAFGFYIDTQVFKMNNEITSTDIVIALIGEIPGIGDIGSLIISDTNYMDPEIDIGYYDKLGGTYHLANFTLTKDPDIKGYGSLGKEEIQGRVVIGPDVGNTNNPINMIIISHGYNNIEFVD